MHLDYIQSRRNEVEAMSELAMGRSSIPDFQFLNSKVRNKKISYETQKIYQIFKVST